ncbi:Gluconolactonase precursor [Thalassoglobus polymorphus]|uniref:Gluconolactonase n=2 Tax=Thalassoglobus polymorphus TaxID=2527994 RepID=A0A517QPV0_9PLAN|nr:Gluconolactonase precursor [Thalassoglobus polymorphus]
MRIVSRWMLTLSLFLILKSTLVADELPAPTGDPAIIPAGAKLEELWKEGLFTEGVAAAPDGRIYFSDISAGDRPGRILRFDPSTKKTDVYCAGSGQSNGLMFDRNGNLIAACGANGGKIALCRIEEEGALKVLASKFDGKVFNSPNDLVIHPDGSIFFSDPRYVGTEPTELDHMSVFRFDPKTQKLTRVTTEITKPNGVILSPDGSTLYVAETNRGTTEVAKAKSSNSKSRMTLNAFRIKKDGTLGKRKILHDFGDQLGIDGMTVDTNGNIYAAVRSAERHGIIVFSPAGHVKAYIPTPDLPTNCCFGTGEGKQTLYLTVGKGLYRIKLKSTGYHPATS